jgi:aminoglycoside phosphotransferase (APT) family kinase protein
MTDLDREALAAFLDAELGPGDLAVEGRGAGYSNETLFVRWGERELVLRRPPPDETAEGAHEVLREYRVLDALSGTDVPVPRVVAAREDDSTLGAPFYVMDRLHGEVIRTAEPARFATPDRRDALATEFVGTLAAVHGVDYRAVGLGDLGDPDGYLERQVDTFREACEWALETTCQERAVPELERVGGWLADYVPDISTPALVHGDYKLDNVMFAPGDVPEIVGVFDWEMGTLGDPLADLAYALHCWPDPDESEDERVVADRFAPRFLAHRDYPTREAFVRRYEGATGIEFRNRRFYLALAAFKMAALGEMFYARYLRGGVEDPMYESMGRGVPDQARRAVEILEGEWTI